MKQEIIKFRASLFELALAMGMLPMLEEESEQESAYPDCEADDPDHNNCNSSKNSRHNH
jgi:hypothetical protein